MWLWPDHLTCPDLERWLPSELGDATVRSYVAQVGGWKPPSSLRGLAERWPRWSTEDQGLDAVVVFGPLDAPVSSPVVDTVVCAGRIIEVGTVARSWRWWLRPWAWRRDAARAASLRVVHWARQGLYDLEQYVALTPCDAVVTLGCAPPIKPRRSPLPTPS